MRSAEDRRSISSCVAAGKEVMSLRTLCFGEVDRVSFGCGKAYGAAVDANNNLFVTGFTGGGLEGNSNAGASGWDVFLSKINGSTFLA